MLVTTKSDFKNTNIRKLVHRIDARTWLPGSKTSFKITEKTEKYGKCGLYQKTILSTNLHVILDAAFEVFGADELVKHEQDGGALAVGDLVEHLRDLGRVVQRLLDLK